jgi:hypothetical protein
MKKIDLWGEVAAIISLMADMEEESLQWKLHRYIERGDRWNALFIIPFKHMWE